MGAVPICVHHMNLTDDQMIALVDRLYDENGRIALLQASVNIDRKEGRKAACERIRDFIANGVTLKNLDPVTTAQEIDTLYDLVMEDWIRQEMFIPKE
jgi:hypothetical protein